LYRLNDLLAGKKVLTLAQEEQNDLTTAISEQSTCSWAFLREGEGLGAKVLNTSR